MLTQVKPMDWFLHFILQIKAALRNGSSEQVILLPRNLLLGLSLFTPYLPLYRSTPELFSAIQSLVWDDPLLHETQQDKDQPPGLSTLVGCSSSTSSLSTLPSKPIFIFDSSLLTFSLLQNPAASFFTTS